ncbi:MAG TPA: serine/threonine-protein kinase [Candidatus Acidoferrales bacterium]|nr:serine/threonine-protein kinase [Candidatus Acidoferrales bacterium]
MIPDRINQYRVVAPLGQGRVGIVYRAEDTTDGRAIALKLVPASHFAAPESKQKFLEEARAAAGLAHPHLRQLYDAGESGDQVFLAMEYLDGSTLRSLLVGGPVEPETALAWGAEIADALAAAHAEGVAHGELTTGKVFITEQGMIKLLDAGLWRLEVPSGRDLRDAAALSESGLEPLAVAVLAPEQIHGAEPDARTDLFALGAVLYLMTTGVQPFADDDANQTMHWVLGRQPEPPSRVNSAVPATLDTVVARLLEKEPARRLASAAEAAAALRAVAAGEPLPASVTEPAPVVATAVVAESRPAAKSRLLYWVAGGVVLAGLLWLLYQRLVQP